ncbi:MAG: c-type cytochrome [Chloroflexi bacterium]|nr:c-type cytochrome [Chloroflexota bacterium]
MHRKKILSLVLVALGVLALILAACAPQQPAPVGNPARGGQLYDRWWRVVDADAPVEDHPLWATQTTNTLTGGDTWRCKECHGWDYKGKDGAYGSGSHLTGFIGVMKMDGKDPNEILAILKGSTNPDHDFSSVMDEQALIDIALFLNQGLIDDAAIVNDDKSPQASGKAEAGKTIFALCSTCHGVDGTAINFDNDSAPEYLGTVASDNPWEFVHKARFGQPGVGIMPAGVSMNRSTQEYIDLLAFVQSLPADSPLTEGGRLYDKWWAAMGIKDPPAGEHPLWATQTTSEITGGDTWRCKECHGWDYKGRDGAYGSGKHFTGFPGVMDAASMSTAELTAWLNGGKNPDHDFSTFMEEAQINMLVTFIQKGLEDRSAFINEDKSVNGSAEHGETLYISVCIRCHGSEGRDINFGDDTEPEYLGTVANDNPWETLHKASVGQPGRKMPAGLNFGWSLQDIADLVAYLQTFPVK